MQEQITVNFGASAWCCILTFNCFSVQSSENDNMKNAEQASNTTKNPFASTTSAFGGGASKNPFASSAFGKTSAFSVVSSGDSNQKSAFSSAATELKGDSGGSAGDNGAALQPQTKVVFAKPSFALPTTKRDDAPTSTSALKFSSVKLNLEQVQKLGEARAPPPGSTEATAAAAATSNTAKIDVSQDKLANVR